MADTPRTNIDGYHRVIEIIRGRIGRQDSPQTFLAHHLGVTRQVVHHWQKADGIPAKHVPEVMDLTGLSAFEIRPSDIAQNLPGSIFDRIAEQAKRRGIAFGDQLVVIIKKGLK